MAAWITNKNAAHTELVQVFETQTHTSFTDYEDKNGLIFLPIIIQQLILEGPGMFIYAYLTLKINIYFYCRSVHISQK